MEWVSFFSLAKRKKGVVPKHECVKKIFRRRMKMLKRFKRDGKKGFTLVELIVVLVILAILAALLVPALTGYIDKAKDKQIIAETRQTVMAAQTLVDEMYAKGDSTDKIEVGAGKDIEFSKVAALAEVPVDNINSITVDDVEIDGETRHSVVSEVVYEKDGKTCTYTADPAEGDEKYEVN